MQPNGVKVSAVLLGLATDIAASMAAGFALGFAVGFSVARSGGGPAEVAAAFANPAMLWSQIAIGTGCSALGGYVAARVAGHAPRLHGAAVGVASVATALLASRSGMADGPAWALQLACVLAIPAAVAGAALVARAERVVPHQLASASQ